MRVSQDLDRPAYQRFYLVAGRLLFFQSFDLSLAAILDQLLSGWLLEPLEVPDLQPHLTITCHTNRPFPAIPLHLDSFAIANGDRCYVADRTVFLKLHGTLVHITSRGTSHVDIWLEDHSLVSGATLARAVSFAICAGLRPFGIFELHGAALVSPEKQNGVLLIGPSGSGKSTLAVQLVTSGWNYLSDDEVLLSCANDEVQARGFRKFFAVSSNTVAQTKPGSGGTLAVAVKTCFDPDLTFAAKRVENTRPRAVFFTSITGREETRISTLSQRETMARLIRACPWATYDKTNAAENIKLLSSLARQCRGFDLAAGTDLLDPDCAGKLLVPLVDTP